MDITAIKQAQQRIKPYVKRTTLEHSETLSKYLGANVFVKFELFQKNWFV
jgi:threonine dehydratase